MHVYICTEAQFSEGTGDGPPKLRRVEYSSLYPPQNC